MILCPNCHNKEWTGALFCSECGAQLISADNVVTQTISYDPSDVEVQVPTEISYPINAKIALKIMDQGTVLQLADRLEFSLGRISSDQPILPDVDLTAFDAHHLGVSRLHASIKTLPDGVVISDLGTANGTRVNGQKILPHTNFPLNHGDIIALGKLKIQVLLQH